MAATVSATFVADGDVQAAVDSLAALGVPSDQIDIITPVAPEQPEALPPPRDTDDDLPGGAAAAGLVGLGAAMGGPLGPSSGIGYPAAGAAAGVAAGVVAGTLMGESPGAIRDLDLAEEDAHLYHQRLREGATVVAVRTDRADADQVAGILHRHHGADIRGGEIPGE